MVGNGFGQFESSEETAIFIGGYEDLGVAHVVANNNFFDGSVNRFAGKQPGYQIGEGDVLNAENNYWGAPSGPNGVISPPSNTDNPTTLPDGDGVVVFTNGKDADGNPRTGLVDVTPWLDAPAPNGAATAPVENNDTGELYPTIQAAVDDASPGDTVVVDAGTFDGFEITTQNVTVSGQHNLFNGIEGTVIEGRVSLTAPETEIRRTKIAPPTFADDPDGGDATNVTASNVVSAVNVTASGAVVDDSTINITSVASDGELRTAAVSVVEGGSETRDVTISDNHIRAEGISENNGYVVANGVVDAGDTEKTLIVNNGIRVTSENTSAAVVSQSLDDRFGSNGAPTSEVLLNEITATSEEGNGVGYAFNDDSGIADATAAEEQLMKYNVFRDVDTINHEGTAGTLDLTVNRWRTDLDSVEFRTDLFAEPEITGGEIVFDPVLTEEKSVEQLNNDELLKENENGELVATTDDYGSYIEVDRDGGPVFIGFPAPSEETISELLSEDTLNREDGNGVTLFIYDNEDENEKFQPVLDPANRTPEAGEVLIIATESGISEDIVVPINTTAPRTGPNPDTGTVELNEGWNLVATGAVDNPGALATSQVITNFQFRERAQPAQPGAPPADFGAYEGTWLFVENDGEIFTGYGENQKPADYLDAVLTPESDDQNDNDT
jgi:hypothetical protein